jgi:hypothetical protein
MKPSGLHITVLACSLLLLQAVGLGQSPHASIAALDDFYAASAAPNFYVGHHFLPEAICHTITYDAQGQTEVHSMSLESFQAQIDTLQHYFMVNQRPVVVVSRYYGNLATAYLSVLTELIDRSSGDTLTLRSMQSVHLIFDQNWFISHLVVQNEVSGFPFSNDFWPNQLTSEVEIGAHLKPSDEQPANVDYSVSYDPHKVYNTDEVELSPTYPGDARVFEHLLQSFGVSLTASEDATPFTVIIADDGLAKLGYVGDLNGAQITVAQDFVQSMMVWYPAVYQKASVPCKLIFYVK